MPWTLPNIHGTDPMRLALLDDYQNVALELADWSRLGADFEIVAFNTPARDAQALVDRLATFDIVIVMRERTAFPRHVIEALPRLKLLVSGGTRNPSIDLDACERVGIAACAAPGSSQGLAFTAEMTWALILALYKRIPHSDCALRAGRWQPDLARGLHGRTLGLVGLGRIGSRMVSVGRAFGMRVLAWSPQLTRERAEPLGATAVDKAELFEHSDVVSLHLVLSERTSNIVSSGDLYRMRKDAILVNTARGGLVDEQALLEVLRTRRIAGAGLDVFWQEPLSSEHELCRMDNVLLTPHLGYATSENLGSFFAHAIEVIASWRRGEAVPQLDR